MYLPSQPGGEDRWKGAVQSMQGKRAERRSYLLSHRQDQGADRDAYGQPQHRTDCSGRETGNHEEDGHTSDDEHFKRNRLPCRSECLGTGSPRVQDRRLHT